MGTLRENRSGRLSESCPRSLSLMHHEKRADSVNPRIYYDGLIYSLYRTRPGGISNFFDHLISIVSQQHDCLLTSRRPANLPHPRGPKLTIARHNLNLRPGRINEKLWRVRFAQRARRFKPELIHCTFYGSPLISGEMPPLIYTAYDMILEKWSHQLDPTGEGARIKRHCFEAAAAIPCISESTRNDLLTFYPHLEQKVSVIHLAGDIKDTSLGNESYSKESASSPYLLYVGARSSYKNFTRLALAFARVMPQLPQLRLELVGAPLETPEVDLLEALNIRDKVTLHADLGDQDLYSLYRSALAFIYPSLYEGFGIPPLEAMAMDTPVLAANTSSIPEVTGDAALLFNPSSVESIAEAIIQIVSKPELREDLRRKGRRQRECFSWEKTAAAYMDLYERMALRRS